MELLLLRNSHDILAHTRSQLEFASNTRCNPSSSFEIIELKGQYKICDLKRILEVPTEAHVKSNSLPNYVSKVLAVETKSPVQQCWEVGPLEGVRYQGLGLKNGLMALSRQ